MSGALDYLIIGAGVTGSAIARALSQRHPGASVAVLEKESGAAMHTSGRNSGVVHAGYNQKPGTLKARLCVEGNRLLKEFCRTRRVPLVESGMLVLAKNEAEIPVLEELLRRGRANDVPGLRMLGREDIQSVEPNAVGLAALHAPSGASVDSKMLVQALVKEAYASGVAFYFGERVIGAHESGRGFVVRTSLRTIHARRLVNCAGLHADRIAHKMGVGLDYAIVPFRGEYYYLHEEKAGILRSMVYSAPELEYPFLGIHWTRTVHGKVKVGPNAVLAFGRESYTSFQIHAGDVLRMAADSRFWKMLGNRDFQQMALKNLRTSLSRKVFLQKALTLLHGADIRDFCKGPAGIRAQVIDRKGRLVDDLLVESKGNSLHILNTVSPGLTCSLSFAQYITDHIG